jgi:hypothetical protein
MASLADPVLPPAQRARLTAALTEAQARLAAALLRAKTLSMQSGGSGGDGSIQRRPMTSPLAPAPVTAVSARPSSSADPLPVLVVVRPHLAPQPPAVEEAAPLDPLAVYRLATAHAEETAREASRLAAASVKADTDWELAEQAAGAAKSISDEASGNVAMIRQEAANLKAAIAGGAFTGDARLDLLEKLADTEIELSAAESAAREARKQAAQAEAMAAKLATIAREAREAASRAEAAAARAALARDGAMRALYQPPPSALPPLDPSQLRLASYPAGPVAEEPERAASNTP